MEAVPVEPWWDRSAAMRPSDSVPAQESAPLPAAPVWLSASRLPAQMPVGRRRAGRGSCRYWRPARSRPAPAWAGGPPCAWAPGSSALRAHQAGAAPGPPHERQASGSRQRLWVRPWRWRWRWSPGSGLEPAERTLKTELPERVPPQPPGPLPGASLPRWRSFQPEPVFRRRSRSASPARVRQGPCPWFPRRWRCRYPPPAR
jgi:hypothetical protein